MFRGLSFDVCGALYASQFEVRDHIRGAGGLVVDIKNEWSSSLPTYVLSSKETVDKGTNDKLARAKELRVPILDSTYVQECLKAQGLLPPAPFQLWSAPAGPPPARPPPPLRPPPSRPTPAPRPTASPGPSTPPTPTPAPGGTPTERPGTEAAAARKPKEEEVNGRKSRADSSPFDLNRCVFHVSQSLQSTPAFAQREAVLQAVATKKCTMVTGPPGCGKTTVIPQLIVDAGLVAAGRQLLVVQPYAAAAVAAGEFVATKRLGQVGAEVGYQIRFVNRTTTATRLVYATTDLVLRRMQIDPQLNTVSCVILDDFHMRDLHTEALWAILRELLRKKGGLQRLVLLGGREDPGNAEAKLRGLKSNPPTIIPLPSPASAVTEHHLEEAMGWGGVDPKAYASDPLEMWAEGQTYALIQALVQWHCAKDPAGAVLIFVPDWGAVATLQGLLPEAVPGAHVLALHPLGVGSGLAQAFAPAPPGKRKILVTTEFGETVPPLREVKLVIHSGVRWVEAYDDVTGRPTRRLALAAREGLARLRGVCLDGAVIHLLPASRKAELQPSICPMRILEDLVLQRKVMGATTSEAVAAGLLSPPPAAALTFATEALVRMGALTAPGAVTPLGRLLARIPVPPLAAKLLLWGAALRVLKPCAVVAAFLATHSPFISDEEDSELYFDPGRRSYHTALVQAYAGWQAADKANDLTYCTRHHLAPDILEMAQVLVTQFVALMLDAGYQGPDCPRGSPTTYSECPRLASDSAEIDLLMCCVVAAFHPNTFHRPPPPNEAPAWVSSTGEPMVPHPSYSHVVQNATAGLEWGVHSRCLQEGATVQVLDSTLCASPAVALFATHVAAQPGHLWLDGWHAEAPEDQDLGPLLELRAKVAAEFQDCVAKRNFSLFSEDLVDEVLGYATGASLTLSAVVPAKDGPPRAETAVVSAPWESPSPAEP